MGFENHDATVVQIDFGCLPCRALVEPVWVTIGEISGAVEPVEVGFVVGDPFFDRLPGPVRWVLSSRYRKEEAVAEGTG